MKSRISPSIYLFFSGKCRRDADNGVFSRLIVASPDCRDSLFNRSFQVGGFETSSRAIHSTALSKLDAEVSESSPKKIKLVTEKPDRFVNTYPFNNKSGKPLSSAPRPKIKGSVATIGTHSPTPDTKLGNHDCASDVNTSSSVSIKDIHPKVGLSQLVEAASVYGKVSGASFATAPNGLRCCDIEFEDVESSRRAILARNIMVGGHVFPVQSLDDVGVVAIRIENISKETTDYEIHSSCTSVGEFVGLARTSEDVVDAFFNVQSDKIQEKILKSLNKMIIDNNHWSARVLASKSEPLKPSSDKEGRYDSDLQNCDHFSKLKRKLYMKRVALYDLELLNASIMHLKSKPPSI